MNGREVIGLDQRLTRLTNILYITYLLSPLLFVFNGFLFFAFLYLDFVEISLVLGHGVNIGLILQRVYRPLVTFVLGLVDVCHMVLMVSFLPKSFPTEAAHEWL